MSVEGAVGSPVRTSQLSGRPRTLADQVSAQLHLEILRGEYPGGAALRIQDLAERYDTSAMPVREALRRLAGLGLVEILPHRGARVLALSVDDLEDTYRTRLALESLAIEAAAEAFTEAQGSRADRALAEHEARLVAGDIDGARDAHRDFHFAIYEASGSRWLLRAIEPVWQNSERYRFAVPGHGLRQAQAHAEHTELLAACRAHDTEAARSAMERHLTGAHVRMRSAMSDAAEAGVSDTR